jgi:hypothetical protein
MLLVRNTKNVVAIPAIPGTDDDDSRVAREQLRRTVGRKLSDPGRAVGLIRLCRRGGCPPALSGNPSRQRVDLHPVTGAFDLGQTPCGLKCYSMLD